MRLKPDRHPCSLQPVVMPAQPTTRTIASLPCLLRTWHDPHSIQLVSFPIGHAISRRLELIHHNGRRVPFPSSLLNVRGRFAASQYANLRPPCRPSYRPPCMSVGPHFRAIPNRLNPISQRLAAAVVEQSPTTCNLKCL